ncbi:hypothetical protein Kpho02_53710 [Kitasatospora phosalacinea]|uniref:Uncharacterized protein n=1 Tax=Kitasatospora phosalacinea TaxID=2065 RepID=A0A9W6QA98_9ACTN|nr:hypothetical protein [Kitasatospora phosalacinea]GLW73072.1 hypothetical protein Kpho02_53710 [Kitasatospora phosalacinea]
MRSARSALLLGATALVGLGLILLLVSGTAIHGGAALGVLAAGWWGIGLVPVHARSTPPEPRRRETGPAVPGPTGAGGVPPDG